jgi:hypothetical protein
MLKVLGEPRSFAVLLPLIMLLAIFDEAALALARRALSLALDHLARRLGGWRFVQLLDETRVGSRTMLSLGVLRTRISALAHVHISSSVCAPRWT